MADGDVAENDEELEEGTEGQQEGGKKKLPLKLIIIVALVLVVGGGAGAFFMMGDKGAETAASGEAGEASDSEAAEGDESNALAEAHYFSLDPPFVVNFTGKAGPVSYR